MKQKKSKTKHLLDVREMNKKIKMIASGPYRHEVEKSLHVFSKLINAYYEAHQENLRATAYHEAGHAVAAYTLLRKFYSISIIPDDFSLGRVAMPFRWSGNDFKEAVINLSGFIAEYKAFGMSEGHEEDFNSIDEWVSSLSNSLEEAALLRTNMADLSIDLFRETGFWEALEALAEALLEHGELDSFTARKIIKNAKQRARRKSKTEGGLN